MAYRKRYSKSRRRGFTGRRRRRGFKKRRRRTGSVGRILSRSGIRL